MEECKIMHSAKCCIIKKNRDVMFMENNGSLRNDLEMRPSGRNEGPTVVVVVDESFKLPLPDGGGQSMDGNEQV